MILQPNLQNSALKINEIEKLMVNLTKVHGYTCVYLSNQVNCFNYLQQSYLRLKLKLLTEVFGYNFLCISHVYGFSIIT